MKIADLDFYSLYGETIFHKIPVVFKLLTAFFVICGIVLINNLHFFMILYSVLISMFLFSSLPKIKPILLSMYSLVFVLIFIFSFHSISLQSALTIVLKVLCASTTFAIIIITTPYIKIFEILSKFMPAFITDALYLTYRSVFILIDIFENLKLSSYIRGSIKIKNPVKWLRYIGNSIGFLVIKSFESSEKFYDTLRIRGYSGRFQSIRQANGKNR